MPQAAGAWDRQYIGKAKLREGACGSVQGCAGRSSRSVHLLRCSRLTRRYMVELTMLMPRHRARTVMGSGATANLCDDA